MAITSNVLERLRSVFSAHGWSVEPGSAGAERFDRLVALLQLLDEPAQSLLIDLTADFLLHSLSDYAASVSHLVDWVLQTEYDATSDHEFIILPLAKESHIGVPKSGSMVAYLVRAELSSRGIRHRSWDRPHLVKELLPNRQDALILIVDDFVGSGESALTAYQSFRAHFAGDSDRVVIGTLVAQQAGLDLLSSNGVTARAVLVRERGISDSKSIPDVPRALKIMDQIEVLLDVPRGFRRGYGSSEALLSLVRCPNNTFPIYWMPPRGGVQCNAPFSR